MRVVFNDTKGFKPKELEKLESARKLLEEVLSHEAYGPAVLNADFHGETSAWKNQTNREILNHIRSGKEVLLPVVDNEVDISVTIFNPNFRTRNVVGYTYRNVVMQWINRRMFSFYSVEKIAGNLMHEWLHKMGFDHDFRATARRPYSVCYQHNHIVKEIAKRIYGDLPGDLTQKPKTYKPSLLRRVGRFVRSLLPF